jgi:hypothetical protein
MKQHEIQGAARKQQSKLVLIGQLFQARDCAYIRRAVEKQLVYTASFPSGSTDSAVTACFDIISGNGKT